MATLVNRKSYFHGKFYPKNEIDLKIDLNTYFKKYESGNHDPSIQAIIVPHAGYVFSGEVATSVYSAIDPEKIFEHIFILAPSHSYSIEGASIYNIGHFETPLGEVPVALELANKLIEKSNVFKSLPEAHMHEHSIEVQLPFLQYHLKNKFQIVPILIGTNNEVILKQIADELKPYFNDRNLFIISSDFSHYPEYEDAKKADFAMKDAIAANSIQRINEAVLQNKKATFNNLATSACGLSAIKTLLYITENNPSVKIEAIKYMNSGDSIWGDHQRVVGYWSFAIKNDKNGSQEYSLNDHDKTELLLIARSTIENFLLNHKVLALSDKFYSKNLLKPTGVFVSLHHQKQLRGCIGRFDADEPLYKMVQKMAIASATQDYRFNPITFDELSKIDVEISVLTPMQPIENKEDIIIGKHGIYIKKGANHGTLLPQVAIENGWNVDEYLGYCSKNKAGLGWDGWKTAEIFVYSAIVFSEKI